MDIQNKATCQSIFFTHLQLEVLEILPSKANSYIKVLLFW